ncbi:MAG: helix-turn-helix domain-containing protein [Acetatifactor sp.]
MKLTYDRLAAGERLRLKRTLLGFTQEEIAEKIERATKYYADIERGSCGMSIETLMALSSVLNMSLDYIICGKSANEKDFLIQTDEVTAIMKMLDDSSAQERNYAMRLLKLFLSACKK